MSNLYGYDFPCIQCAEKIHLDFNLDKNKNILTKICLFCGYEHIVCLKDLSEKKLEVFIIEAPEIDSFDRIIVFNVKDLNNVVNNIMGDPKKYSGFDQNDYDNFFKYVYIIFPSGKRRPLIAFTIKT